MSANTAATTNHRIIYAHRPEAHLTVDDFQMVDGTVPAPGEEEVLCRTILLSVDPANRAWMQGRTYRDQLTEGEVMAGFTLCEVVAENGTDVPVGSIVACEAGWQEYAVLDRRNVDVISPIGPLTHHMSVLGITGLTAYFGLLSVGRPRAAETVLVSAAAGATGNVVGQLARIKGCRVIGVTGSDEKNAILVDELGFDGAVNHRSPDFTDKLRELCPVGVDLYFDNVGGPVLERALALLRPNGRVVCCGVVSQYDTDSPAPGPRGVPGLLVTKRLRMEGFIVTDFAADWPNAVQDLSRWIDTGEIRVLEDVVDGLENAPQALVGMLAGDNIGKRIIRVAPDPG